MSLEKLLNTLSPVINFFIGGILMEIKRRVENKVIKFFYFLMEFDGCRKPVALDSGRSLFNQSWKAITGLLSSENSRNIAAAELK